MISFPVVSLHFFEQCVESLEVGFPEFAIALQPFSRLSEWLGVETAWPALSIAAARNQPRSLQHFEVLGNGWLGHRERLGPLHKRRITSSPTGQNRPPRRSGKPRQRRLQSP